MSYSISDTKTKALIYNTIEQKLENTDIADQYIKIVSFNKVEESHYNATIDLLMTEGDKVTKASIKSATISGTSEEEEKEEANTTNGTNNNQINPIIFLFNFTLITLYFIYYNLIVSNIKKKIFY